MATLEQRPKTSALPEGTGYLTIRRGHEPYPKWDAPNRGNSSPEDRGVTISITPSADVPAPTTEVTISGYVKGDFIYDFDENLGDSFGYTDLQPADRDQEFHAHARQTRFRIKSRTDTAIGEIRTLIEGDFYGSGNPAGSFRLRHAWGEWDFMPNWTFGAGRYWTNFAPGYDQPPTVDFNGPAGLSTSRQAQVRVTYESEGLTAAVALEHLVPRVTHDGTITVSGTVDPSGYSQVPHLTGTLKYESTNNYKLSIHGVIGQVGVNGKKSPTPIVTGKDTQFLWGVIGAGSVTLGEVLTILASGGVGRGAARYLVGTDTPANVGGTPADPKVEGREYASFSASALLDVTEEVSFTAAYGHLQFPNNYTNVGETKRIQTVHVNVLWQPVSQMKMGLEVMWAKRKIEGVGSPDAVRGQFGTWFFF
ncbi:MAG: DcaP family trimeric outer membrane transporter [Hyphomicrobiales bacterium]